MAEDRASKVRALLDAVRAEGRTALTAPEGKVIADAYGIAVPGEELARDVDEAVACAARLGGPVVMKIVSPDILHKTDAGGVVVGVEGAADVRAAFCRIVENARAYDPGRASRACRCRSCCRGVRRSSSARSPTRRSGRWWRSGSAGCSSRC